LFADGRKKTAFQALEKSRLQRQINILKIP
jgi:hypothetical protein